MRFKNTEISRNPFICYGGYQTTRLLVFVFHVDFSIPACFCQWQWLSYSRCVKIKHINIEMMLAAATFACTFVAVQSFVPGRTFSSISKPITALAPPIKATHYESIAEIRQVKVIKSGALAFSRPSSTKIFVIHTAGPSRWNEDAKATRFRFACVRVVPRYHDIR
jgi:hypothetical protein